MFFLEKFTSEGLKTFQIFPYSSLNLLESSSSFLPLTRCFFFLSNSPPKMKNQMVNWLETIEGTTVPKSACRHTNKQLTILPSLETVLITIIGLQGEWKAKFCDKNPGTPCGRETRFLQLSFLTPSY